VVDIFISFFNIVLYQPLFNGLIVLYQYLPGNDFGIAVIVLTILIRLALYPLGVKGIKIQKTMSELQPKIKEIQEKFKDNKQEQAKATMELFQKEKVNPFSGCLPILVQLPILIALYRVFWKGLQPEQLVYIYSFIPSPEAINPYFLGIINLAEPCIFLAFLAGILQFFQTKIISPKKQKNKKTISKSKNKDQMAGLQDMMSKQTLYFFPIFTVIILWTMPSAIGLYWIVFTLFAIIQQYLILKPNKHQIYKH